MVICSQDKNTEGQNKLLAVHPSIPALSLSAMKNRKRLPTIFRHIDRKMGWMLAVDREGKVIVEGDSDAEKLIAFIENGCIPLED